MLFPCGGPQSDTASRSLVPEKSKTPQLRPKVEQHVAFVVLSFGAVPLEWFPRKNKTRGDFAKSRHVTSHVTSMIEVIAQAAPTGRLTSESFSDRSSVRTRRVVTGVGWSLKNHEAARLGMKPFMELGMNYWA